MKIGIAALSAACITTIGIGCGAQPDEVGVNDIDHIDDASSPLVASINLGYGPNLFYALADNTAGTNGSAVTRFGAGQNIHGLTFPLSN